MLKPKVKTNWCIKFTSAACFPLSWSPLLWVVAPAGFLCICTTVLCIIQGTTISPLPDLAPPNFCYQVFSGKARTLCFPLDGARVSIRWLILHVQTELLNLGILHCGSLGCNGLSGQGTVRQEWKTRVADVLDLSVPIPPPLEGGGHSKALLRFSLGPHIAGVFQQSPSLCWSRAEGRTWGMVIPLGPSLLELICVEFWGESKEEEVNVCPWWKG